MNYLAGRLKNQLDRILLGRCKFFPSHQVDLELREFSAYEASIWTFPRVGYSGLGRVSIKAELPGGDEAYYIGIDHWWFNGGIASMPDEEGSIEQTSWLISTWGVAPGETKTFELSAGPHEVKILPEIKGNKSSDALMIMVEAESTLNLICGDNLKGWQKDFYWLEQLIPGVQFPQPYYYLKRDE